MCLNTEQLPEAKDGQQKLVWYCYLIAEWMVINKDEARIFQRLALLTGR